MWYRGQKVVCVKEFTVQRGYIYPPELIVPCKDAIYTLRDIVEWPDMPGDFYFVFYEISNKIFSNNHEPTFISDHFRPLCEKKSDISVFKKMLVDIPALEVVSEWVNKRVHEWIDMED